MTHRPRPWLNEEDFRDQLHRSLSSARREQASIRRLEAVFEEEDAAEAARLGEEGMGYRFKCKFCGSQFSLEQQLEAHERECGRIGGEQEALMSDPPKKILHCRRCKAPFPDLKSLSRHARDVHADEHRALVSASLKAYHTDRRKMDKAALAGGSAEGSERARPVHGPSTAEAHAPAAAPAAIAASPRPRKGHRSSCPLCGGTLPAATATLVAELRQVGLPEEQAFAAARVARKVLLAGAPA